MGSSNGVLSGYPPNSPDLNPIENLWGWASGQIDKKGCASFEEFKQEVIHTLENVPKGLCARLVGSMKKRVAQVLKNGGRKIKY